MCCGPSGLSVCEISRELHQSDDTQEATEEDQDIQKICGGVLEYDGIERDGGCDENGKRGGKRHLPALFEHVFPECDACDESVEDVGTAADDGREDSDSDQDKSDDLKKINSRHSCAPW